MYAYEMAIKALINHDKQKTMNNKNEGKCGHALCAGGVLCYEKGAPMSKYEPVLNRYVVEFTHAFEVNATTEAEAIELADKAQDEAIASRTMHHHANGDPVVYDVTNTDDHA